MRADLSANDPVFHLLYKLDDVLGQWLAGGCRFNPRPSRRVLERDTSPCSCVYVYECNT